MPYLRGIGISITLRPQTEKLCEFPHPDASSVRALLSQSPSESSPDDSGTQHASSLDSKLLQKASPRASVYIPSVPETRFSVDYSIICAPGPPCHAYFKMFMNGRHITSWGINPAHATSGSVSRALYEPSSRWHYDGGGIMARTEGIEARSFYFSPIQTSSSVADEGGLIEINVFRAKNRRRRAQRLEPYRSQDQYGIISPSSGLLESPEETSYYDWVLLEPRDSPFASFRFHYRSWENLCLLNLAMHTPASLLPRSMGHRRSVRDHEPSGQGMQRRDKNAINDSVKDSESNTLEHKFKLSSSLPCFTSLGEGTSCSNTGSGSSNGPVENPGSECVSRNSTESQRELSIAPTRLPYIKDGSDGAEYGMVIRLALGQCSSKPRPLPEVPRQSQARKQ